MKRILPALTLFLQLTVAAGAQETASPGQPAPLDLNGYISELKRWSASASRLKEHPGEAAALSKQLPEHWAVDVQGQRFLVSTQWLHDALDWLGANPKMAAEAAKEIVPRLEVMRQAAEALAATPTVEPGVARGKLEGILKRREFRGVHGPNLVQTLWDRVTGWLLNHLGTLFGRLRGHPTITTVVLWGIVVVLGLVFLVWLVKVLLSRSPSPSPALASSVVSAGTWREWVLKARSAAEREEYRDAIRFAYAAAVDRLGELKVWQVDPSRTHREYLRLLPGDAAERAPMVAIAARFEQVWYGREQATAGDFQSAVAQLERLG